MFCARRDLNSLPFYTLTEVTTEKIKILSPMSNLKTHSAPISSTNWKGSVLYNCLVKTTGLWLGDHGTKRKREGKEGMAPDPSQPEQFHCYLLYILDSCKIIHLEKLAYCLKKKRKGKKKDKKNFWEKKANDLRPF